MRSTTGIYGVRRRKHEARASDLGSEHTRSRSRRNVGQRSNIGVNPAVIGDRGSPITDPDDPRFPITTRSTSPQSPAPSEPQAGVEWRNSRPTPEGHRAASQNGGKADEAALERADSGRPSRVASDRPPLHGRGAGRTQFSGHGARQRGVHQADRREAGRLARSRAFSRRLGPHHAPDPRRSCARAPLPEARRRCATRQFRRGTRGDRANRVTISWSSTRP